MEILKSVENLTLLCRDGDATKLQEAMFSEHVVICGEGSPDISFGKDVIKSALTGMLEVTPELSVSVYKVQQLTDDVVTTWLEWKSPTSEGEIEFRSLTVWQRDKDSWKIVSDMYGMGRFVAG